MIDTFIGTLMVVTGLGWLAYGYWSTRRTQSSGGEGTRLCPPRSSTPDTPRVVVYSDTAWQPEDLHALRVLLAKNLPLAVAQAQYDAVLDAIARGEAHEGIDAVEDAANHRSAS